MRTPLSETWGRLKLDTEIDNQTAKFKLSWQKVEHVDTCSLKPDSNEK